MTRYRKVRRKEKLTVYSKQFTESSPYPETDN
jgi:hypothetical protein